MKRVVVDPVTRIEGHLRLEIQVDESTGKVSDALSSGTEWRGLENIVKDRDPREVWAFIQRICGVCTSAHALASVRAVEDALGIKIPRNAHYIRNIMGGTINSHDHLVHFYHLYAFDWVSPMEALKADPAATAALQKSLLDGYQLPLQGPIQYKFSGYPKIFPQASANYFGAMKDKLQKLVEGGQFGLFAANWWNHPAYKILPPEVHLLAITHYLNLLNLQRDIVIPHVVFGGKNPHPHYVVGGMGCAISMNDMNAPVNTARLDIVAGAIDKTLDMINYYMLPDALAICAIHAKAGSAMDGGGLSGERVIGFGGYPEEPFAGHMDFAKTALVRCDGVVENFAQGVANAKYYPLEGKDFNEKDVIVETSRHSWYKDNADLHPWEGKTNPNYTGDINGDKAHWSYLDQKGKYSWVKTPKWRGKVCETGPLARYIIVYTKVKQSIIAPTWAEQMMVAQIDRVSALLGMPPEKWLPSTVGRTITRALDAQIAANMERFFFDKLVNNIKTGDTTIANTTKWNPSSWTDGEFKGVGMFEAPRGALSHWVVIKDKKVKNYQAVVPTTWNACPIDDESGHGSFEKSMIDTHVAIADQPLEIVRAIRSFDPCLACAAHVYNSKKETVANINTDPFIGCSTK